MASRKTGRPDKAPADRKDSGIRFRVTSAEREKIEAAANEARRGLSDFVRIVVLDHIEKPRK